MSARITALPGHGPDDDDPFELLGTEEWLPTTGADDEDESDGE